MFAQDSTAPRIHDLMIACMSHTYGPSISDLRLFFYSSIKILLYLRNYEKELHRCMMLFNHTTDSPTCNCCTLCIILCYSVYIILCKECNNCKLGIHVLFFATIQGVSKNGDRNLECSSAFVI